MRTSSTWSSTPTAPTLYRSLRPSPRNMCAGDASVRGTDSATCLAVTPRTVTVRGTSLEAPPAQLNGGGFNSSLSADTVMLQTPLAPGQSINVRFLLGVQQSGTFKFFVNIEALP